jgi:NifU-like protein
MAKMSENQARSSSPGVYKPAGPVPRSTPTVPAISPTVPANPPAETSDTGDRKYSRKIESLAQTPKHRGAFFTEDASTKDLALATAKYKDIKVYWLIDPQSDLIYDAKFFSYGGPASVALGEMLCTLAKGMKVETATAFTIPQIEALLRDEAATPATAAPAEETFASLPPLLSAIKEAYAPAKALALATIAMKAKSDGSPRRSAFEALTEADKNWLAKPKDEQISAIETIIDKDIRPGLNMDGGDLHIRDLEDGERLMIKWQGACGGCASSTGATLSYIEDSLRRQVFSGMQVIPVEE